MRSLLRTAFLRRITENVRVLSSGERKMAKVVMRKIMSWGRNRTNDSITSSKPVFGINFIINVIRTIVMITAWNIRILIENVNGCVGMLLALEDPKVICTR